MFWLAIFCSTGDKLMNGSRQYGQVHIRILQVILKFCRMLKNHIETEWKYVLSTWQGTIWPWIIFLNKGLIQKIFCVFYLEEIAGNSLLLWILSFLLVLDLCSYHSTLQEKFWEIISCCKCAFCEYFIGEPILLMKHLLSKFSSVCNFQAKMLDNKYQVSLKMRVRFDKKYSLHISPSIPQLIWFIENSILHCLTILLRILNAEGRPLKAAMSESSDGPFQMTQTSTTHNLSTSLPRFLHLFPI